MKYVIVEIVLIKKIIIGNFEKDCTISVVGNLKESGDLDCNLFIGDDLITDDKFCNEFISANIDEIKNSKEYKDSMNFLMGNNDD